MRGSDSGRAARFGGCWRPLLEEHEALVRAIVEAEPDITLIEIQAELSKHCTGARK
jgi:hypothetical protein